LIALLAFILGIWLWDHYFGKSEGYPPGTQAVALVKIDRDLRLADAMSGDPAWLRTLAGVDSPAVVRREALEVFQKLAAENSLGPQGLEAFAIIKAEHEGLPMRATFGRLTQGLPLSDFDEISEGLATHRGTWWHAKLADSWEENYRPTRDWRQSFQADGQQLRARALAARGGVWGLGLLGLALVPGALVCFAKGLRTQCVGYAGAWPVPLGLVIFMVATLAWIGFTLTLNVGIGILPGLHPLVGILLDSAARMLPALIALALLFRRPGHALRVLGLGPMVAWRRVLGTFSLLILVDQILLWALGSGPNSPGGGLSPADFGGWGLAFALVSACLLAPVAEELLYRGVLFGSLRNRLGVLPAAVFSSAIFAVLHFYDGYGLASVAIFGLSAALLYAGTGSLTTVIVLHMLYNSAIKIPEWIVYHAPLG
jgi:membrane protease YdiL (CAAX protease family)